MRIRTFGSVIALSSAATVVVTACGDDTTVRTTEPCTASSAECVSDKVGRACPEGPEPGWVYFACGDSEVCDNGACVLDTDQAGRLGLCEENQKECVSDALARQCAKGGNAWLPLACPSGTVCEAGDCVPAGDAGGVKICEGGQVECATEYAVKTCQNDGSEWVVTLCQAGELCQDGACVPNRNGSCVPNTSQCLDASNGLRCREDGQGYDEFTCPAEAPCDGFKCQGTVCTPGETKCPDPSDEFEEADVNAVNGHFFAGSDVFQCNATGSGWDVIPCDPGSLCVYNSLTPTESQAYEDLYITYMQEWIAADNSSDGDAYPPPPVFIHPPNRFMEAACIDPACEYAVGSLMGQLVCGSPDEPSVDKVGNYSQCEGLAPFSAPQWVPYTCEAPEMCNPMEAYYGDGDPCNTDCIPGEVVCGNYFGGDNDSVYGCNENGEWEEQQSCNEGVDKAQTCFQFAQMEEGDLRSAQCVDPLCAIIWSADQYNNPGFDGAYYGFCDGGELRNCDESGQVVPAAEAMACSSGVCFDSGYYGENNGQGYTLGWCEEECQDGETRCVDIYGTDIDFFGWGEADSPFFMTCVDGVWERGQYEACPPDVVGEIAPNCFQIWEPAQENENIAKVVCGGECQPTFRQCGVTDDNEPVSGVQTCGDDAMWSDAVACDVGSCRDERNSNYQWDAECVFDCVPGTYTSVPEGYLADAGAVYYGEAVCGEDGRYGDPVRCDGPYPNFLIDERVGCFECYGPELSYYWSNYWGWEIPVESMCDLDGNIVWCGQDNTWEEPTSCGQGNTCYTYTSRGASPTGGSYYRSYCAEAVPPPPAPDAGDAGDGG